MGLSGYSPQMLAGGHARACGQILLPCLYPCCRYMLREASIVYVARDKVRGVPHHAKAGNINSALLKAPSCGDFVLVLDCDMVLHPDFLMRTLGHFYWQPDGQGITCPARGLHSSACPQGLCSSTLGSSQDPSRAAGVAQPPAAVEAPWVLKEKAAFIQTPQVCGPMEFAALCLALYRCTPCLWQYAHTPC